METVTLSKEISKLSKGIVEPEPLTTKVILVNFNIYLTIKLLNY